MMEALPTGSITQYDQRFITDAALPIGQNAGPARPSVRPSGLHGLMHGKQKSVKKQNRCEHSPGPE